MRNRSDPPKLFHRPGCIPDFDHLRHFILLVHGKYVDIVRMGLLVRRWHRPALAGMFGMVGGKEDRCARCFVIAGGVQVVGGAGRGDGGERGHPITVRFDRVDRG